jgi:hypothetical protein
MFCQWWYWSCGNLTRFWILINFKKYCYCFLRYIIWLHISKQHVRFWCHFPILLQNFGPKPKSGIKELNLIPKTWSLVLAYTGYQLQPYGESFILTEMLPLLVKGFRSSTLTALEQEGIFIVPHLLWHRMSVLAILYEVQPPILAASKHGVIRTNKYSNQASPQSFNPLGNVREFLC